MIHHPVFERFERVKSVGTGNHVFDFIGSKTNVDFRRGWRQHAVKPGVELTPSLPPMNEHYFDWIATLSAVDHCSGTLRMAELGAGWAPWLVRAALAARQRTAIQALELVAVEADETHFSWVNEHFRANGLSGSGIHLLRGAVAATPGVIRFPRVDNPDENYGASTRAVSAPAGYVEVAAFAIDQILDCFSGPVDLMHIDIQGAEYDVLPPAMNRLKQSVRSIMVGTHHSLEMHRMLAEKFKAEGWVEVLNFDRNALCETEYGPVQFGDGFLLFSNPFTLG